MGEIIIRGYLCERCDHKWPPRNNSTKKPFVCPKCKSPYWDVSRKTPKKTTPDKPNFGLFPEKSKKEDRKELWQE